MKNASLIGLKRLFVVQLWLTLLLSGIFAFIQGGHAASSAALGGLTCLLPQSYFALKLFKYQGARAARQIVNAFYKGEAMKLVLSVLLFAFAFAWFKVKPLPFFIGFISVQSVIWLAPLLITKNGSKK